MFHFHRLRFTKSNYLNKNICSTKFHLRWYELFSNSIALEGSNFRNSAVVISHTDKPISFSHINSGIIPFNIQVHLLDFIAWTLRNEVFPGVMACTGWTRMEEAIPMHFRPTVTWRHTMEDGPCVTLPMNMSDLRVRSHTTPSFLMEATGGYRTDSNSIPVSLLADVNDHWHSFFRDFNINHITSLSCN